MATADTVGAWYRGRRVVAVDGTTLDVADTDDNNAFFGRPRSGRGERKGAFPQVRLVVLAECGTHAVFAATTKPCTVPETVLADTLLPRLQSGMLLLADRGVASDARERGDGPWTLARSSADRYLLHLAVLTYLERPRVAPEHSQSGH
ncbi:hypothetical protein ACFQ7B_40085 [Streptomyces erythrochromogenes]|uniref:hypothetical protein n=1 Tax=Streptomyces erythrochromogenes TaxID=285574 RepID=UPI0036A7E0C4